MIEQLTLDITRACNLNCVHCYASAEDRAELTTAEIIRIVEWHASQGGRAIHITGGEPLMRTDCAAIVKIAAGLGLRVSMNTNAARVTRKIASLLAHNGLKEAKVSLYGDQTFFHEAVTRTARSFTDTTSGIELLREAGISVAISTVIMRANLSNIRSLAGTVRAMGLAHLFDPFIVPKLNGDRAPLDCAVPIAEALKTCVLKRPAPRNIDLQKPFCGMGQRRLAVNPYGDALPCLIFPMRLGNVRDRAIADILRDSQFLREFRATRIADTACGTCEHFRTCRLCPGEALVQNGDWRIPSARLCELMKCLAKK